MSTGWHQGKAFQMERPAQAVTSKACPACRKVGCTETFGKVKLKSKFEESCPERKSSSVPGARAGLQLPGSPPQQLCNLVGSCPISVYLYIPLVPSLAASKGSSEVRNFLRVIVLRQYCMPFVLHVHRRPYVQVCTCSGIRETWLQDPSFSICCCRTLSKAGTYCIQSAQHVVDTQNTVIIIQHINTLKLSWEEETTTQ